VKTLVKMREGRSLVMGSIGYMAPELEMGVAASPQSDWYALGVIVYRLLTGTWCDSRTDVQGTLETYDPVWKRIVPKLLHANPNGRECLSYADEKRADREQAEFEADERWQKAKSRGHLARHVARWMAVALVAASGTAVWLVQRERAVIADLRKGAAMPVFSELFAIPPAAGEDEADEMPSREDFRAAMIDALVLTKDLFADMRKRTVTAEGARAELGRLLMRAQEEDSGLFDGDYSQNGDFKTLAMLLADAIGRLPGK